MSDFESTCIRNDQSVECLQLQVYPNASERSSTADEHADSDRCPGRYLEPRRRSFARRLRGFLPRRDVQGRVPRDRSRADRRRRARIARGLGEGRERGREGREPRRPSAVARLLRRRAAPGAPLRSPRHPARRRRQGLGRRRADDQGRHPAGRRDRDGDPADGRSLWKRAHRPQSGHEDRSHRLRGRLEQPASERSAVACERRHHPRRAAVREAGKRNERVTRIRGISGSLRRDSHNTSLLRAPAEAAGPDVELELYDGLKEVAPYDEDDDMHPRPASVARLNAAIADADAVLFATPEYNSSIPGQLKNAIDWVSRQVATNVLRNKPVLVVGASTGAFGAAWAQAELRKVLAALGARVVDVELPVPHVHARFEEGELTDEEIRARLAEAVEALAAEIRQREGMKVVA